MKAIVLVGGEGSRIRHLVGTIPKPLVSVAGKPFLHWVSRWVLAQGIGEIILAAYHLAEQIEEWATAEAMEYLDCRFKVMHEPKPFGTGGAILNIAAIDKTPDYLALNGDSIAFCSLAPAREWLDTDQALDGIIIAKPVPDTARFGSLEARNGLLVGFREKVPGKGLVNAGLYLLRRRLLNMPVAAQSIEYDCFPRWISQGARIGVMLCNAPFLDIGTPETLRQAEEFIKIHGPLLNSPAQLVPVTRSI